MIKGIPLLLATALLLPTAAHAGPDGYCDTAYATPTCREISYQMAKDIPTAANNFDRRHNFLNLAIKRYNRTTGEDHPLSTMRSDEAGYQVGILFLELSPQDQVKVIRAPRQKRLDVIAALLGNQRVEQVSREFAFFATLPSNQVRVDYMTMTAEDRAHAVALPRQEALHFIDAHKGAFAPNAANSTANSVFTHTMLPSSHHVTDYGPYL